MTNEELQLRDILLDLHKKLTNLGNAYANRNHAQSCAKYVDYLLKNLNSIDEIADRTKKSGVIGHIAQMNKGLIDIGGWESDKNISSLIKSATDQAVLILEKYYGW